MLTTVLLSTLLMLGGLRSAAAASDFQDYGKSIYSGDDGRQTVRKQPRQQTKSKSHRSLDLESVNVPLTPSTSKISLPNIVRLYPPTAKPLHQHANMPMRFGRQIDPTDEKSPNSRPNMPQRFGRSWKVIQMCAACPLLRERPNLVLPQRYGSNRPYWSLFRTMASAQLLNAALHWDEEIDFTKKK